MKNGWIISIVIFLVLLLGFYFLINNLKNRGECSKNSDCEAGYECNENLKCVLVQPECLKAGELCSFNSSSCNQCCINLTPLDVIEPVNNYSQFEWACSSDRINQSYYICSDCGNGICENWENRCNCRKDCDIKCLPEGEYSNSAWAPSIECCPGLTSISCDEIGESGICRYGCLDVSWCTNCGNNICDEHENKCNCPEDCGGDICGNGLCGESECTTEQALTCGSEDMTYCNCLECDDDCI